MAVAARFLVAFSLILRSRTTVNGLRCFNCSSVDNYKCGDPFDAREFPTIECKTSCFKTINGYEVTRGCSRVAYYAHADDHQCLENARSLYDIDVECLCQDVTCNESSTLSMFPAIFVTLPVVISSMW